MDKSPALLAASSSSSSSSSSRLHHHHVDNEVVASDSGQSSGQGHQEDGGDTADDDSQSQKKKKKNKKKKNGKQDEVNGEEEETEKGAYREGEELPLMRRKSTEVHTNSRTSLHTKTHECNEFLINTEDKSTINDRDSEPSAPDGGWGWVIVFASFFAHAIADGISFSIGIFYSELLDYFKTTRSQTAWVSSLFVSIPLIMGPLSSVLTNRYGCRNTTMVGGFIAGMGFVLGSRATSLLQLSLSAGLVSGFGLSLVYVPAVVIVAQYFERMRAFATGLAVAGSGIGTALFAPIITWLIDVYEWQGALLILGGACFNLIVCGLLFRPLQETAVYRPKRLPSDTTLSSVGSCEKPKDERVTATITMHDNHAALRAQVANTAASDNGYDHHQRYWNSGETRAATLNSNAHSLAALPTYDVAVATGGGGVGVASGGGSIKHRSSRTRDNARISSGTGAAVTQDQGGGALSRSDVFYRGSLTKATLVNSRFWNSCPNMSSRDATATCDLQRRSSASKSPAASSTQLNAAATTPPAPDDNQRHLWKLTAYNALWIAKECLAGIDMSLLRSKVFAYFCLSNILLYAAYDVPYVYTPNYWLQTNQIAADHEHNKFVKDQAASLVSYIGLASTIGQIVIGYIGDRPAMNSLTLYAVLTAVAGIATTCMPLTTSYGQLAAVCSAYGAFISANYSLTTIILVDLVGMSRLTSAYGVVMFSQGIANLVGPPAAGWLVDIYSGEYLVSFITSGVIIVISGLMLLPLTTRRFQHLRPPLLMDT